MAAPGLTISIHNEGIELLVIFLGPNHRKTTVGASERQFIHIIFNFCNVPCSVKRKSDQLVAETDAFNLSYQRYTKSLKKTDILLISKAH